MALYGSLRAFLRALWPMSYPTFQQSNLDIFTRSYTGDLHLTDRKGSDPRRLEHPLLTVMIAPQPDVLKEIGEYKDFRDRGSS